MSILRLLVFGIAATLAYGQSFEVASIKPSKDAPGTLMQSNGRSLRATNASVGFLIRSAYKLYEFQLINAPSWLESDRYDVDAKAEAGNEAPTQLMLQALLAERMQLKVHWESRQSTVYSLRISKDGHKLKLATPEDPRRVGLGRVEQGRLSFANAPISSLTGSLSRQLGQIVIDDTGLTGNFDFALEWAPDDSQVPPGELRGPSLFTALPEQLGLRLESTKGPVQVLVIDAVQKPSPN